MSKFESLPSNFSRVACVVKGFRGSGSAGLGAVQGSRKMRGTDGEGVAQGSLAGSLAQQEDRNYGDADDQKYAKNVLISREP